MIKRKSILVFVIITYVIVIACKSAILGPEYPITDFNEYNCVVVATVDKATHDTIRYSPLKTFNLTIKKALKGVLEIGEEINGKAKQEEARAACPVHLDENSDYLLLLTKTSDGYRLSRFSLPVKKGYLYFDNYIEQIENSIAKNNKN